jgi:hypothetical protein
VKVQERGFDGAKAQNEGGPTSGINLVEGSDRAGACRASDEILLKHEAGRVAGLRNSRESGDLMMLAGYWRGKNENNFEIWQHSGTLSHVP